MGKQRCAEGPVPVQPTYLSACLIFVQMLSLGNKKGRRQPCASQVVVAEADLARRGRAAGAAVSGRQGQAGGAPDHVVRAVVILHRRAGLRFDRLAQPRELIIDVAAVALLPLPLRGRCG